MRFNSLCAFQLIRGIHPRVSDCFFFTKAQFKENECWTVFTSMNTDHKYALMHRSILWCIIQIYFIFQSDALHTNCNNIMCDIHRNHHCHRLRYKICTVKYHFSIFYHVNWINPWKNRRMIHGLGTFQTLDISFPFHCFGYIPLLESSLG